MEDLIFHFYTIYIPNQETKIIVFCDLLNRFKGKPDLRYYYTFTETHAVLRFDAIGKIFMVSLEKSYLLRSWEFVKKKAEFILNFPRDDFSREQSEKSDKEHHYLYGVGAEWFQNTTPDASIDLKNKTILTETNRGIFAFFPIEKIMETSSEDQKNIFYGDRCFMEAGHSFILEDNHLSRIIYKWEELFRLLHFQSFKKKH